MTLPGSTRNQVRQTLRLVLGLCLGGYVALAALATIDPKRVLPFLNPGWLALAALGVGGLLALVPGPADGQRPTRSWLAVGAGIALALSVLPGFARDGLSGLSSAGWGLGFGLAWWSVERRTSLSG